MTTRHSVQAITRGLAIASAVAVSSVAHAGLLGGFGGAGMGGNIGANIGGNFAGNVGRVGSAVGGGYGGAGSIQRGVTRGLERVGTVGGNADADGAAGAIGNAARARAASGAVLDAEGQLTRRASGLDGELDAVAHARQNGAGAQGGETADARLDSRSAGAMPDSATSADRIAAVANKVSGRITRQEEPGRAIGERARSGVATATSAANGHVQSVPSGLAGTAEVQHEPLQGALMSQRGLNGNRGASARANGGSTANAGAGSSPVAPEQHNRSGAAGSANADLSVNAAFGHGGEIN